MLGRRFLRYYPVYVPLIGAVMFAVHPLQVESVAWIAERKNLLGLMFFLLAFVAHIDSTDRKRFPLLVLAYIWFALGLMSKTAIVGAPILFSLYDLLWGHLSLFKIIRRNTLYFVFSLLAAIGQIVFHSQISAIFDPWGVTIWDRVRLIFVVSWDYFWSLIWFFDLNNLYIYYVAEVRGDYVSLILGILVWITLILLFALDPLGDNLTRFTVVWIVVWMLPVSNIVPISIQRADRYLYGPSVIIFMVVALALARLWQRIRWDEGRYLLTAAAGGWFALAVLVTVQYVEVWQNSHTLWVHHREDYPTSSTGWLNDAVYLWHVDDYVEAVSAANELLEHHPRNWKGYRALGHIAYDQGNYFAASEYYKQAIEIQPDREEVNVDRRLGNALVQTGVGFHDAGNYQAAHNSYMEALTYVPDQPVLYNNIGFNFYVAGDYNRAIAALERAIELNPDYLRAYINLQNAANQVGNTELALSAAQNVERLQGTS